MKIRVTVVLSIFLLFSATSSVKGIGNTQPDSITYLFKSKTMGYNTFRIPAIITTIKGSLLAFAEGRKNGSSDTGDIDLVMKRSEDKGKDLGASRNHTTGSG